MSFQRALSTGFNGVETGCSIVTLIIVHVSLSSCLQESQLYYDPECGTYYEYDTETRQYQVHSRVKLPSKRSRSKQKGAGQQDGVIDLCSSSESDNEGI